MLVPSPHLCFFTPETAAVSITMLTPPDETRLKTIYQGRLFYVKVGNTQDTRPKTSHAFPAFPAMVGGRQDDPIAFDLGSILGTTEVGSGSWHGMPGSKALETIRIARPGGQGQDGGGYEMPGEEGLNPHDRSDKVSDWLSDIGPPAERARTPPGEEEWAVGVSNREIPLGGRELLEVDEAEDEPLCEIKAENLGETVLRKWNGSKLKPSIFQASRVERQPDSTTSNAATQRMCVDNESNTVSRPATWGTRRMELDLEEPTPLSRDFLQSLDSLVAHIRTAAKRTPSQEAGAADPIPAAGREGLTSIELPAGPPPPMPYHQTESALEDDTPAQLEAAKDHSSEPAPGSKVDQPVRFPKQVGIARIRVAVLAMSLPDRASGPAASELSPVDEYEEPVDNEDGGQRAGDGSDNFALCGGSDNRVGERPGDLGSANGQGGANSKGEDGDGGAGRKRRRLTSPERTKERPRFACPYQAYERFLDCLQRGPRNPKGGCDGIYRLR